MSILYEQANMAREIWGDLWTLQWLYPVLPLYVDTYSERDWWEDPHPACFARCGEYRDEPQDWRHLRFLVEHPEVVSEHNRFVLSLPRDLRGCLTVTADLAVI